MSIQKNLELAANAGGIKLRDWREDWKDDDGSNYGPAWRTENGALWNPLKDDGDMIRLAFAVKRFPIIDGDTVKITDGIKNYGSENIVDNDTCAAARRAVVMAAIEIVAK